MSRMPDKEFGRLGLLPPGVRQPLPEGPNNVCDIVPECARKYAERTALVDRTRSMTFDAVNAESSAAMAYLSSLGVRPGDRVAACAANGCDLTIAFFATQRLGAIWVGINRNTATNEKRYFLEDAGVKVFLGDEDAANSVAGIKNSVNDLEAVISFGDSEPTSPWRTSLTAFRGAHVEQVEIDPWAPAAISYASGTTGYPKGAVHSQHSIALAAWVAARNSGRVDPDVVRATALPMTILNLMILGPVCAFATGAKHVCIDKLEARNVADWISREKINTLSLVPTIIQDLLTSPDIPNGALSSLSWLVGGAAMVPEALPGLYRERFGRNMITGYGLTECPTGVAMTNDETPESQGAIGKPHFHLEVGILDDEMSSVPVGEAGEICLRAKRDGPWKNVFTGALGYWCKPDATEALHRGGWLHTGDIGRYDKSGHLFILDRRSDLIVRGGANIYPAEVERVIRMHPGVRDVAVVGIPDPRLGETVAAIVEAQGIEDVAELESELLALCQSELARYKHPVVWSFSDTLARNNMGKVLKQTVRSELLRTLERPVGG